MLRTAQVHEGLEFSEFCEPLEDHGFGCFARRAFSRHRRLWQSIVLSVSFHIAVISVFILVHKSSVHLESPSIEVRLVSLGSGDVAAGSGDGSGSGEASVKADPAAEKTPPAEAIPSEQKQEVKEKTKEKNSKRAMKQSVTQPSPITQPKEADLNIAAQSDLSPTELPSPPSQSDQGSTELLSGKLGSAEGLSDSVGVGSGSAGGTHGKGGNGAGPEDAEFGSVNGPRFAHKVMPKYPRLARELGKEAVVVLRVTIDETGRPITVEALKTAGSGFDEEAIKAVKGSRFTPAKREGKAVICRAILPIRFELRGSE